MVTISYEVLHRDSLRSTARRNRNKLQITQAILEVARDGAGKTRIMYQANLSFKLLEDYLTVLVRAGLLKVKEGDRKMYMTSEKGLQFLREFQELERYAALATARKNDLTKMLARAVS